MNYHQRYSFKIFIFHSNVGILIRLYFVSGEFTCCSDVFGSCRTSCENVSTTMSRLLCFPYIRSIKPCVGRNRISPPKTSLYYQVDIYIIRKKMSIRKISRSSWINDYHSSIIYRSTTSVSNKPTLPVEKINKK